MLNTALGINGTIRINQLSLLQPGVSMGHGYVYLMKNNKIVINSTTAEGREKIREDLESFRNFLK